MKLLSIVVPVYNVAPYLTRCVMSLVDQTYPRIEIILVNDGSTDDSGSICNDLADQYECVSVVHKPNGGLSSARNAGLEIAKGEYIGFVDSDDWASKDMFEILVENLEKYEADVSACDFIHEYGENEQVETKRANQVSVYNQQELYQMTIDSEHFAGYACNKLFRRSSIGTLRFDETLSSCEDIDFVSKLVANCQRGVYEQVGLYHYYHHPQSMTGERNFSYRKMAVIHVYERLIKLYTHVCPECLSTIYTNYLKQNINVKGRYICSRTNDPETLECLNHNIKGCFSRVMKDKNVGMLTKINIVGSSMMPGLILRIKQFILQASVKFGGVR